MVARSQRGDAVAGLQRHRELRQPGGGHHVDVFQGGDDALERTGRRQRAVGDHAARHQQPVEACGVGASQRTIDIEDAAIFDRRGDTAVELRHIGGNVLIGHDRGALESAVAVFAPQHHRIDAHGGGAIGHGRPQAGVDVEIGKAFVVAMQVEHDVVAERQLHQA